MNNICPACEQGNTSHFISDNDGVMCIYLICDKCGSELATSLELTINAHIQLLANKIDTYQNTLEIISGKRPCIDVLLVMLT